MQWKRSVNLFWPLLYNNTSNMHFNRVSNHCHVPQTPGLEVELVVVMVMVMVMV